MKSPTLRTSRTIRQHIAKRNAPGIARKVTLDRKGLMINGERFQHHIGSDVDVDYLIEDSFAMVTVGIFTDEVEIKNLPSHTRVTLTTH